MTAGDNMQRAEMEALPESWELARLGDVCRTGSGGTPSRKKSNYFGGSIPWLKSGELNGGLILSTGESITTEGLESSNCKILPQGTLLIALYGATVGKLGVLGLEAAINQAICAISTPLEIEVNYLFWFLSDHRNQLLNARKGGAQPNISQQIVNDIRFPLAPLPEQRRIVAKIEQLLSDLDAGVAALQKAKAQLKRYRQAVLKAAVEGRLTAEWRAANAGKIEPASVLLERIRAERAKNANRETKLLPPVDTTELGELPEGWCWASLAELSWDAGYGTSVKCGYDYAGAPVIRIPNIANGRIDVSDLKFASQSDGFADEAALGTGDLLVIRTNGSRDLIGRAALVMRALEPPHFYASYLIRFRLVRIGRLPLWVMGIWHSPLIRAWIERAAATTAGQYNVSMTTLNKLPVPLPPYQEQEQIVAELERRLSVADEVERTVDAGLAQAERLRQSILKRAFAGKLVPQDPNDEPAEKLLERITEARRWDSQPTKRPSGRKRELKLL